MNTQDAINALDRAKPLLTLVADLSEALKASVEAQSLAKQAKADQLAAEKEYQIAYGQREQIIEATKNLTEKYAVLEASLATEHQAKLDAWVKESQEAQDAQSKALAALKAEYTKAAGELADKAQKAAQEYEAVLAQIEAAKALRDQLKGI